MLVYTKHIYVASMWVYAVGFMEHGYNRSLYPELFLLSKLKDLVQILISTPGSILGLFVGGDIIAFTQKNFFLDEDAWFNCAASLL